MLAALLDWVDGATGFDLDVGTLAPWLVTVAYLVAWEMGVQRVGAGWPDALVDTLAVGLGGFAGLFLWRRAGVRLALVLAAAAAVLWRGVRARR